MKINKNVVKFTRGNTIKMNKILQAYNRIKIKHQNKETSQQNKNHNYLNNYN